jgi:hypothetical protein
MSHFDNYQSGFVPSRLRKARIDDEAPNAWGKNKASERAILRSLSRNYGVMGGRRRHSLAGKGDFGQHFRNALQYKPHRDGELFGAPAGSSAYDYTTVHALQTPTQNRKSVDYIKQPSSDHFYTGSRE